jgi:hypothetical protein
MVFVAPSLSQRTAAPPLQLGRDSLNVLRPPRMLRSRRFVALVVLAELAVALLDAGDVVVGVAV